MRFLILYAAIMSLLIIIGEVAEERREFQETGKVVITPRFRSGIVWPPTP